MNRFSGIRPVAELKEDSVSSRMPSKPDFLFDGCPVVDYSYRLNPRASQDGW